MMKNVLFLLMFLPALAFSGMSRGEKLERHMWKHKLEQKIDKIKGYTSKEFQFNNNGFFMNRFATLDLFKTVPIVTFELSNIKVTSGDKSIVVTYHAEYTFAESPIFTGTCLSVWKKFGNEWKWVAHAVCSEMPDA